MHKFAFADKCTNWGTALTLSILDLATTPDKLIKLLLLYL